MTAAYEDGPYRLQDSHAQRAFVSWQYVAPLIYARQVMITLGIETVLLEKSQHGFCIGIIISSALLHKVRHLQFWRAMTYGEFVCVLQPSVFERHGSGITPHGIHDVSR